MAALWRGRLRLQRLQGSDGGHVGAQQGVRVARGLYPLVDALAAALYAAGREGEQLGGSAETTNSNF